MIIYFEGLSCAGKTTLIEFIAKKTALKTHVIKELPVDYSQIQDIDNYCRKNDEIKCSEALLQSKDCIVLVDRGYASTLAYNYIQYKLGLSKEYIKSKNWYIDSISNNKLARPDLYIYLDVDSNEVEKRAESLNKYNKNIAWYAKPEEGKKYYDMFFEYIEPEVPILRLNGKDEITKMSDIVLTKINEFQSNV